MLLAINANNTNVKFGVIDGDRIVGEWRQHTSAMRTADEHAVWLMQLMANLVSNAAKFSPPGGEVSIGARVVGPRVRVEVSDRGRGIPEEFRGRIFQRFSQADASDERDRGGTGLGLAICKAIVERCGGTIGFEDRAGGGTTFWFELAAA